LVNMKKQMGLNLQVFKIFKYCVYNNDEFAEFCSLFYIHSQNIFHCFEGKRGGSGLLRPNSFGSVRIRIWNTGSCFC